VRKERKIRWGGLMRRTLVGLLITLGLGGCGVGENAVSAAAGGASKAQEAQQARQTEERVKEQLDAAARQEAARRAEAEAGSQ
jgi:hypothetical protein